MHGAKVHRLLIPVWGDSAQMRARKNLRWILAQHGWSLAPELDLCSELQTVIVDEIVDLIKEI